MRILKTIAVLLFFLGSSRHLLAQDNVVPLQVGDRVPDLEFTNLINTDKDIIRLADYKGKLIILDFFGTWCRPCVTALPHLDSLQKVFKDRVVILPITLERDSTVRRFLEKQPQFKLSLPYIFGTDLKNYFPHTIVPHEVWIDGDGKVVGLTDGEEVTAENIRKILSRDSTLAFREKRDLVDSDLSKPFMAGFFGSYKFEPNQLLYNSILTQGFEGVVAMAQTGPSVKDGQSYLRCSNNFVTRLYWTALLDVTGNFALAGQEVNKEFYEKKEFYKQRHSRVIWEAKDSSLYFGPDNSAQMYKKPWKDFVFHYELRMPTTDKATFKKVMLDDLNRYFGLKHGLEGLIEKRKVKCYALTRTGPEKLFKSKGGEPALKLEPGVKGVKVVNKRIDDVMFWWLPFHVRDFPIPIVNETNYDGPVDLDLGDVDPTDFHAFNDALKRHGLEFKLVKRKLDMIVIRDVKKH